MTKRERLSLTLLPAVLLILNVDGTVVLLRASGLFVGLWLAIVGAFLAVSSSWLWYYVFGIVARLAKNPTKPVLGSKIGGVLVRYEGKLKGGSLFARILRFASYPGLFIAGLTPEPGTRMIGAVHCGLSRSRIGLVFLMAGNTTKTVLLAIFADALIPKVIRMIGWE